MGQKQQSENFFWQDTFDKFIEGFIIRKTPLITEGGVGEFLPDDITDCLEILKDVETMNPLKDENKEDKSLYIKLSNLSKDDKFLKIFSLLWHCYWIMYLMGETAKGFMVKLRPDGLKLKEKMGVTQLFVDRIASTNQAYNSEGIRPFKCLLVLIQKLWGNKYEDTDTVRVKEDVVKLIWINKGDTFKESMVFYDDRIKNILLYLCNPQKYYDIVSQDHKNNIFKYLGFLVGAKQDEYDEEAFCKIEKAIQCEGLSQSGETKHERHLYDKKIRPFWDTPKVYTTANKDGELETATLLRYKKAIVLYGPPGTSKSFMARELAENLICSSFAEKLKDKKNSYTDSKKKKLFTDFIASEDSIFGKLNGQKADMLSHIHRLQMHPNYTYDDFIVGKTIGEKGVEVQEGYLLKLISEINKDKGVTDNKPFCDLPHVVILDEINRVDISRVFGELFTAMESDYRDTGCDLPVTKINETNEPLKLKVPNDLYFIGTMNQIDFSLEQVDFALRRRFAWVESTFNKDKLKEIIEDKLEKKKLKVNREEFDFSKYAELCQKLNNKIGEAPGLGEEYWIGHTFFTDIVDVYIETDKKNWNEAKKLLWFISIKPTIDAYCGNMEHRKEFVKDCENLFLNE